MHYSKPKTTKEQATSWLVGKGLSLCMLNNSQVSYRILGRGYFSTSLFAGHKYTEIEGRGSHLK